ncbi:MAG: peptidylprolyl isomerase [Pseudomonadota bacterium]
MNISEQCVVSFHYTLTDGSGNLLETSAGEEPLAYLHGAGNIMPALEKALLGKTVGDKLNVNIPAAEAYGFRDESMVQELPSNMFQDIENIEVGMQLDAMTNEHGTQIVTVTKIDGDMVVIDGNHALAGLDLIFDVEVTEVRSATQAEKDHGHAHGAGGHHHH